MPGRIYPTVAEAKEFHKLLIEEFGGTHGLRDEGRLEAALFRPQTGYYATLAEEAAALMESLANNITGAMSKGEFRFEAIRDWISAHLKRL